LREIEKRVYGETSSSTRFTIMIFLCTRTPARQTCIEKVKAQWSKGNGAVRFKE